MSQPIAIQQDDKTDADAAATAGVESGAKPAAPVQVTVASMTSMLDDIRRAALARGHSAAAVSAALGMARLAGLFKDKPERAREMLPKFDGNYHEAARRVMLLMRLGKEKPAKAKKKSTKRQTDGHRDRPS